MRKKSISLRTSVVALASTVALAALMTTGATTAFASTATDSVQSNLTSASVTAVGPYSINDAADMTALDTYVEGGGSTANVVFNLNASVTLGSTWDGIGSVVSQNNSYGTSSVTSASKSFDGIFHGNGNTITLSGGSQGVFAFLGIDASVDDFTVAQADGATYGATSGDSTDYIGAVAGFSRGKIEKVTNNAIVYANNAYNVGGIVGFNDGYNVGGQTYIKDCLNKAAVTGKQKVGGIAGENAGYIVLCQNEGKIVGTNTSSKNGVGGIAGRNGNNNTARETGVILSCLNKGEVGSASQKWVGGITGFQNSKSSVTGCLNTGNIVSGAGYNNPIVGLNEGTASGSYYVGDLYYSSSSTAAERGTKWESDSKTGVLSTLLNNARNTTIITDVNGCWTGTGSDTALTRTAAIDKDAISNKAMGGTAATINVYLDGSAGNDSNAGTDSTAPVKTLERAAAVVSAGGDGSKIFVSGTATVSSDVAIRQNITISWTGDSNGTMFTVTDGTLTLGGSVKVVAGTGASATAFDLTGGNLVVQDSASITAGKYAAKVASGKTISINNSSISGSVYLYSGGLLNLPSVLSSNINVECASLTTSLTAIANCGSDDIANVNTGKITIDNGNAALYEYEKIIYCYSTANNYNDDNESVMSGLSLSTSDESNVETLFEWNVDFPGVDGNMSKLISGVPEGWKMVTNCSSSQVTATCRTGDPTNGGKFPFANCTYKGKTWWIIGSASTKAGTDSEDENYYVMPDKSFSLGNSASLSFETMPATGVTIAVYVSDDAEDINKYELVNTYTIGNIADKSNVMKSCTSVVNTTDLSKYAGTDKYVIFGVQKKYNLDFFSSSGGSFTIKVSNVKLTSEVPSTDPAMTLTTDAKDLKVGDEVTVNVDMENITAAGQGTFEYSDNLELQSITKGSALSGDTLTFYTGDESSKTVSPTFLFANNEGTTDGTVAVATFKCTKAGSASVSLTKAVGSKFGDPTELEIADAKLDTFTIGLNPAIKGDVNNSGKLNVVDAQVAYDMVNKVYAEGTDSRTKLISCWEPETTGATYELIEGVANVNGGDFDAQDAFAILVAAHNGGWTTA